MKSSGKLVKNYEEYLRKLKESFEGIEMIPEDNDIQQFISCNNLYDDWHIVLTDVKQDIRAFILSPKLYSSSKKKKPINSYKEYLEKLRLTFGIPETIPDSHQVNAFIEDYRLFQIWGITEEDVEKDLQSFIDGKYDEMLKDAAPIYKPTHVVAKTRPCTSPIATYHPANSSYTLSEEDYSTHKTKSVNTKKIESSNVKNQTGQNWSFKIKSKKKETIFIDGDNHVSEGQKGIEHLSKSTNVRAIFSQEGAKRKFDRKYGDRPNVSSKLVEPGNQAVDNQIKSEVGQLLKKRNQDITIVSHDKGFTEYRDRKKKGNGENRISVTKSVKERTRKR